LVTQSHGPPIGLTPGILRNGWGPSRWMIIHPLTTPDNTESGLTICIRGVGIIFSVKVSCCVRRHLPGAKGDELTSPESLVVDS